MVNPLLLFFGLLLESFKIAAFCSLISLPILFAGAWCISRGCEVPGVKPSSPVARWHLAPFAIPGVILLLGVVFFEDYWPRGASAVVGTALLQLCLFVHLVVAFGMVTLAEGKRPRLFVLAWSLLDGLASFCTYAASYMAITGCGP